MVSIHLKDGTIIDTLHLGCLDRSKSKEVLSRAEKWSYEFVNPDGFARWGPILMSMTGLLGADQHLDTCPFNLTWWEDRRVNDRVMGPQVGTK